MSKFQQEDFFSVYKIIHVLRENWYWFVINLFLFLFVALLFNRYYNESYFNNLTIHIQSNENNLNPLSDFIDDPTLSNINFTDEISFLSSYPLIYKTLDELNFNISYFIQGDIKTVETYNFRPITFVPYNLEKNYGLKAVIKVIDKKHFSISIDDKDFVPVNIGEEFRTVSIGKATTTGTSCVFNLVKSREDILSGQLFNECLLLC